MKSVFLLIVVLISYTNTTAQNFNKKEIKKLNSFQIDLQQIDFNKPENKLNLDLILKKDRLRKANKNWAIVLVSLSALTTASGIKLLSESNDDIEGLAGAMGAMLTVGGVISGGVSIPLFISSKKRKNERDKLIKLF